VPHAAATTAVRRRRRVVAVRTGIAALLVTLLTGCIGAMDRPEFDAEVQRRGGGIADEWILDGLTAVADEVDAGSIDELSVITMTITPTNRSLVVQARRGDRPDFVDTVTVIQGDVVGVSPVQDADELPLDEIMIPVTELPIDGWDELGDRALAELGFDGGYVDHISLSVVQGEHRLNVYVDSPRETGWVTFDREGRLLETHR
jgi:hypothetical protein